GAAPPRACRRSARGALPSAPSGRTGRAGRSGPRAVTTSGAPKKRGPRARTRRGPMNCRSPVGALLRGRRGAVLHGAVGALLRLLGLLVLLRRLGGARRVRLGLCFCRVAGIGRGAALLVRVDICEDA